MKKTAVLHRFLNLWRRKFSQFRSDADLQAELESHLAMQTEENVASGLTPVEAARRARVKFGHRASVLNTIRDGEIATFFESCLRDFSFTLRSMRKEPLFFLTAVFTMALGIAANTTIFGLLYGLVLQELPVHEPDRLAHVRLMGHTDDSSFAGSPLPFRMFEEYRRRQHSFSDIAALDGHVVPMQDREGTLRLYTTGLMGGSAFRVLGLTPYLGRLIGPQDDVRGGPAQGWPVVLSYGFWNDHFARDPHIIGRPMKISGIPAVVVGVTPPGFYGLWPGFDVNLYLPLQFEASLEGEDLNAPNLFYSCHVIGRLKPGVTLREANQELALYQHELLRDFIPLDRRQLAFYQHASLRADPARHGLPAFFTHIYAEPLYLMQGLMALVLVLCCVNVGGLILSKVYARQHEFALRTAIGAGSWRLARQCLTESLVIGVAATVLAAVAAQSGSSLLLTFFRDPNMPEPPVFHPDFSLFGLSLAFMIFVTLAFGLLPAWWVAGTDPGSLLKTRSSSSRTTQQAARTLIPLQVGMSLVLVMFAALLSQSLIRIRTERTGFDLDHVTIQTPSFNLLPQRGVARLDLYQRMVDRLNQTPGIRSAAVTRYTPMTGFESHARVEGAGSGQVRTLDSHMAYNEVGPGYFHTIGTKIVAGRDFAVNERSRNVCVLNQSAAQYLFPHEQALGQFVRSSDRTEFTTTLTCRIIGIAEDAKFADLRRPPPRTLYFPLSVERSDDVGNLVFLINSEQKAQAVDAYRQALREIAPSVPLVLFVTLREQMDAALGSQRLVTVMSTFFGLVALFLSALGIFAVLSSSVERRRAEIGVRIALGAERKKVVQMILLDAFRLLAFGIGLGCGVFVMAVRLISGMLYRVPALDGATLAATVAVLIGVTFAAGLVPALRAGSVSPIEALRSE